MDERPYGAAIHPDGTLMVSGSVDELAVDDFRWELHRCMAASSHPVVDLSDVDFLPSLAVGVLVGAMKRGRRSVTVVARKGSLAAKVLAMCDLPFEHPEGMP